MKADRLKAILTKGGKTIPAIADDINMTKQGLYYALKKPENLSIDNIRKLSMSTGIGITTLIRAILK